jgi:hypothetical protein
MTLQKTLASVVSTSLTETRSEPLFMQSFSNLALQTLSKYCTILVLASVAAACSSSASKERPSTTSLDAEYEGNSKRYVIDKARPASFEDYKKWRQENAPTEQTYAEYIEWEAAYKRWQKNQASK